MSRVSVSAARVMRRVGIIRRRGCSGGLLGRRARATCRRSIGSGGVVRLALGQQALDACQRVVADGPPAGAAARSAPTRPESSAAAPSARRPGRSAAAGARSPPAGRPAAGGEDNAAPPRPQLCRGDGSEQDARQTGRRSPAPKGGLAVVGEDRARIGLPAPLDLRRPCPESARPDDGRGHARRRSSRSP